MKSALAFLFLVSSVLVSFASTQERTQAVEQPCARTFILVRHAEKASTDPADPELSVAGVARAERLAWMLQASGVTHLFATEFRRTQQTLAPLAKARELEVQAVPARDPSALVAALSKLPCGSVAVVSGHSNTLPPLLSQLAPGTSLQLEDKDYDRLFVVTSFGAAAASSVELRF